METEKKTSSAHMDADKNEGVILQDLAELPKNTILDQTALAKVLNVTTRTVRRMVARFELPPPIRFAGRSSWIVGRVLDHIGNRVDRAAREAEKVEQKLRRIT